ncbi:hypothetical protein BJ166DRAFT_191098 [Pestalotiopsis sp. NC0098]|nr:hypothetical protein BJ166DRAFT_191098 [Pestalotiopsis sp. NC0098]
MRSKIASTNPMTRPASVRRCMQCTYFAKLALSATCLISGCFMGVGLVNELSFTLGIGPRLGSRFDDGHDLLRKSVTHLHHKTVCLSHRLHTYKPKAMCVDTSSFSVTCHPSLKSSVSSQERSPLSLSSSRAVVGKADSTLSISSIDDEQAQTKYTR